MAPTLAVATCGEGGRSNFPLKQRPTTSPIFLAYCLPCLCTALLSVLLGAPFAAVARAAPSATPVRGTLRGPWEDSCAAASDRSGWSCEGIEPWMWTTHCTVDRVEASELPAADFEAFYREQQPVILTGLDNESFATRTTRHALVAELGHVTVTLSSANSISHDKRPMLFSEYLDQLKPQNPDKLGNETLYLFGPNAELGGAFEGILAHYRPPPFSGDDLAFSFGVGASGTGVPFHVHGQGFSEVVHGHKRWLLSPPHAKPRFHPDEASARWLRDVLPELTRGEAALIQDCIIGPGEALYFPSMWWHAIVNIGEGVFVSSFDGAQRPPTHGAALQRHSAGAKRPAWWLSAGVPGGKENL